MELSYKLDTIDLDWQELNDLYKDTLGEKDMDFLRLTYANSMFKCFLNLDGKIVGAGRAIADGGDCSYLCDIAVSPEYQGQGLGKKVVQNLLEQSKGHKKIILYANPGKEGFYAKLGFYKLNTAMAIFSQPAVVLDNGVIAKYT